MKWLELSVKAPGEYVEPFSHIFHKYGSGGVVLEQEVDFNPDEGETPPPEDWITLRTYIPLSPSTQAQRQKIDLAVRLVSKVFPLPPLQERVMEASEWMDGWKRHFHPLRIGKRTVVRPPWENYQSLEGEVVIQIDPGMAFGTGHHPTTRMCLEEVERLVEPDMRVLDVGTGSGVLAILAAGLGASRVLAMDLDPDAIKDARRNIRINGMTGRVQVLQGTLPNDKVEPGTNDLVVANISALAIFQLAHELVKATRSGGRIIASGFLEEKRHEVEEALYKAGAQPGGAKSDGDWVTLVASSPS